MLYKLLKGVITCVGLLLKTKKLRIDREKYEPVCSQVLNSGVLMENAEVM